MRDQVAGKFGMTPSSLDIAVPLNQLGVDSLIAVELRSQIERDLGIAVPVVQLLDGPSVAGLADWLGDRLSGAGPAQPDPTVAADTNATLARQSEEPEDRPAHALSYGQRSLWFLYQLAPGSPAYTITYAGRISGDVDVSALERAAQALVDRHAILRTTYTVRDGQPLQLVHPQWPVHIARHDLGPDELHELATSGVESPIRSAGRPSVPADFATARTRRACPGLGGASHRRRLLVHRHHSRRAPPALRRRTRCRAAPALPTALRRLCGPAGPDACGSRRGTPLAVLESTSWPASCRTSGYPSTGRDAAVQTYRGAVHRFTLDSRLTTGLKEVGRRAGATPYMTLFAAYATLLHRYSGQDDLLIGSPFGCRDQAGLDSLVGYIANPVVLRADLQGDPTFTSLLGRVKETVLGALAHQDYPFVLLVERLRPARDLSHTPLFQVSFAWEQPRRFQDSTVEHGSRGA